MMRIVSFCLVMAGTWFTCMGQGYLLFHKNNHREAKYKAGDVISFSRKGDNSKITERIVCFEDTMIVFEGYKLNPNQIMAVYIDSKTRLWYIFRYKYKTILPVMGTGYLLLDVLNAGKLKEETLIISGSLIAAGLLAKWLISEKIKIKGRRRLIIVLPFRHL